MTSINFLLSRSILILGLTFIPARSYGEEDSSEITEYVDKEEFFRQRISLSHAEGSGPGYSIGYSSLDLFLSKSFDDQRFVPFLDLRGHVFNNGRYAGNIISGLRYWDSCSRRIWGINVGYDYLQHLQHYPRRSYHQIGAGIEVIGEKWDFHLNTYTPVGHKKTNIYRFRYGFLKKLKRNSLSHFNLGLKAREQLALNGIDSLFGYRFCNTSYPDLHISAGPYYYWGCTEKTTNAFAKKDRSSWGGRLIVEITLKKYLSLTGMVTYDTLFKWRGQCILALDIPFDIFQNRDSECGSCSLRDRLYDSVERNEIIAVDALTRFTNNPRVLDPNFKP